MEIELNDLLLSAEQLRDYEHVNANDRPEDDLDPHCNLQLHVYGVARSYSAGDGGIHRFMMRRVLNIFKKFAP